MMPLDEFARLSESEARAYLIEAHAQLLRRKAELEAIRAALPRIESEQAAGGEAILRQAFSEEDT